MQLKCQLGGWGARKHVDTKELLTDDDKFKAFQEEFKQAWYAYLCIEYVL